MVERFLAKEEVASSNLVYRSTKKPQRKLRLFVTTKRIRKNINPLAKPDIFATLSFGGPVAELVDARDLNSLEGNFVRVQVPPGPPRKNTDYQSRCFYVVCVDVCKRIL